MHPGDIPKYRAATARRTVRYRRAARNHQMLCSIWVYGMEGLPLIALAVSILPRLYGFTCIMYRFIYLRRTRYHIGGEHEMWWQAWGAVPEDGLHGTIPYRGLCGTPKPHAAALRIEDGTHILDGQEYAPGFDLVGIRHNFDVVTLIRNGSVYNKRKREYEITNH